MIYGKLVGGALHGAPRPIKTSEGDVFTTDPNLLLQYGYKPIITAEYPSDGGYYTESWTETESEIKQIWTAARRYIGGRGAGYYHRGCGYMTRTQAKRFREMITRAAAKLTNAEALTSISLFEPWSDEKDYSIGDRVRDGGKLYRCYNAISASPTWLPSATPAHWERVTVDEDGTIDNPITAAAGMRYFKDKYYLDGGKIYRCTRDDSNGQGTILQYLPSQLVGIYFEEVTG